mmetsp:Transcript_31541/g.41770  ORF Transcript_31541/g.41770 Transcript_31541/m.41770 type:complete len:230 (+) Transcript_31541:530-1219(+)
MEGNKYGFRTTPRACDDPTDKGHFEKCDADGDLVADVADRTDFTYGPGGDINTNYEVDVTVEFFEENDVFTGYSMRIEQGNKIFTIEKKGDYLAKLTPYLKAGMVFQVRQLPGDSASMDYLNHGKCSGACREKDQFKWGNLDVDLKDKTYPPSEPAKDDYEWEEAPWDTKMCSDYGQDECKYSWRCISCRKSYPKGDPDKFDSKDSKCRCYDWTAYPTDFEEPRTCPHF